VAKTSADKSNRKTYVSSECPLAGAHLLQGIERLEMDGVPDAQKAPHPIQLLAKAYGFGG